MDVKKTIAALEKNGFAVRYFAAASEAAAGPTGLPARASAAEAARA